MPYNILSRKFLSKLTVSIVMATSGISTYAVAAPQVAYADGAMPGSGTSGGTTDTISTTDMASIDTLAAQIANHTQKVLTDSFYAPLAAPIVQVVSNTSFDWNQVLFGTDTMTDSQTTVSSALTPSLVAIASFQATTSDTAKSLILQFISSMQSFDPTITTADVITFLNNFQNESVVAAAKFLGGTPRAADLEAALHTALTQADANLPAIAAVFGPNGGNMGGGQTMDDAINQLVNQLVILHDALVASGGIDAVRAAETKMKTSTDWPTIIYGDNAASADPDVMAVVQGLLTLTYASATDSATDLQNDIQLIKASAQKLNPAITGTDIYHFYDNFRASVLEQLASAFANDNTSISFTAIVDQALEDAANNTMNTSGVAVFKGVLGSHGLSVADLPAIKDRATAEFDPTNAARDAIVLAYAGTQLVQSGPSQLVVGTPAMPYQLELKSGGVVPNTFVTWKSSDSTVASFDGNQLTPLKEGTTTVTAYIHNIPVQTFTITVSQTQSTGVANATAVLDPSMPVSGSIPQGTGNVVLDVYAVDANYQPVLGLTTSDFSVAAGTASLKVESVQYDNHAGMYVVKVTDNTAGSQLLEVSVDNVPAGSLQVTIASASESTVALDPSTPPTIIAGQTEIGLRVVPRGTDGTVMQGLTKDDFSVKANGEYSDTEQIDNVTYDGATQSYLVTFKAIHDGPQDAQVYVDGQAIGIPVALVVQPASLGEEFQFNGTPYGTVGRQEWFDVFGIFDAPNSTDNVYYTVKVVDANGQPVTGAHVFTSGTPAAPPTEVPIANGVATIGGTSGVPVSPNHDYSFEVQMDQAGEYQIVFAAFDSVTGQELGSGIKNMEFGNANVTGTVLSTDGKPVDGVTVYIHAPGADEDSSVSAYTYPQSDTSTTSTFSVYLPAGQYMIDKVYDPSAGPNGQEILLAQPISFTVDPLSGANVTVTEPTTGTLTGTLPTTSSGVLTMYPATAAGQPDYTKTPVYVQFTNGTFTQLLPEGDYYITDEYVFGGTDPSAGGESYTINKLVHVTANETTTLTAADLAAQTLTIGYPVTTVSGEEDWHQISVNPANIPTNPVYVQVSVKDAQGNPVTTGVTLKSTFDYANIDTFTMGADGTATLYKDSPVTFGINTFPMLITDFQVPGNYTVTYNLVDASTNQVVATGSQHMMVQAPNLIGTLYAADGKTPVGYESVKLTGSNGNSVWLPTDVNGNFQGYLSPGTWTIKRIQYTDGTKYDLPGKQQVTFTILAGQTAKPKVIDPTLNVIGTAYVDAAQTTPLTNGGLMLQAQNSANGNGQQIWVPTDENGHFIARLTPGGAYTVVEEGNATAYVQLAETVNVQSTGVTNVTVAPQSADFNFTVTDSKSKPIQSGFVGIMSQTDYTNSNYNNAKWFSITNGSVSGYLPAGDYVAFTVSGDRTSFPIETEFTITDENTVKTGTLAPTTGILSGSLLDADGTPMADATIVLQPHGSNNPNAVVSFTTDENGNFTDLGWNNQGKYTDLVQVGNTYDIIGISDESGWVPFTQTFTVTQDMKLPLQLPKDNLNGTVTVDNNQIQNGWIAFGPTTLDPTGSSWQWAQIKNGTYSVSLPQGKAYRVYVVQDDTNGNYYDESARDQETPTISSDAQPANFDFENNFTGQLTSKGNGIPNATIMVSPKPNPTTSDDWNNVQYITTDAHGNFSTYLNPNTATWYVVGVYQTNGTYTQLNQPEALGTGISISITPNVSGTISWGSPQDGVSQAWLVVQSTGSDQTVYGTPLKLSGSNWTYEFTLPTGSYQVLGIDEQDASYNHTWVSLLGLNKTLTVASGTPATLNINITPQAGTISGVSAKAGYILFQSTSDPTQYVSVPFKGTKFTTTLTDAGWKVVGVETSNAYYPVSNATYDSTTGWTIAVN